MITLTYLQCMLLSMIFFGALYAALYQRLKNQELKRMLRSCVNFIRDQDPKWKKSLEAKFAQIEAKAAAAHAVTRESNSQQESEVSA